MRFPFFFHALRLVSPRSSVTLPSGAYWETISFLKSFGFATRNAPSAEVLYWDSSTERAALDLKSIRRKSSANLILALDTTCLSHHSHEIEPVLEAALAGGMPCVLFRSHLKIDCLGMEYGRLGSWVILIPKATTKPRELLARKLRDCIQQISAFHGTPAEASQVYPFFHSKRFHAANEKWIARIRQNNRAVVGALQAACAGLKDGFDPRIQAWLVFLGRIPGPVKSRPWPPGFLAL